MKPTIEKEFINARIIEKLNKIGYDKFYEDQQSDRTSYEVDFVFNLNSSKYLFKVEFEINLGIISCDTEFYGLNVDTQKEYEFKTFRSSNRSKTLQELFDIWHNEYCNYISDQKQSIKDVELTNDVLNEKIR